MCLSVKISAHIEAGSATIEHKKGDEAMIHGADAVQEAHAVQSFNASKAPEQVRYAGRQEGGNCSQTGSRTPTMAPPFPHTALG